MEQIRTASASASAFLLLVFGVAHLKAPTVLLIMKGCGRAVAPEGTCQKSSPGCCH